MFLTVARTGPAWSVLAGPAPEYEPQKTLFLEAATTVDEIQIWSSSRGVIKRRRPSKKQAEPAKLMEKPKKPKMKTASVIALLGILLLFAFSPPAVAQETFAGTGEGTTTLSYFIAGPSTPYNQRMTGTPRLQYINATSDKAGSVIQFYTAGEPALVTGFSTNGQKAILMAGTGYASNDVLVVRSVANDTYARYLVTTNSTTNVTVSANLSWALDVRDQVFKMTTAGKIPVGAATKELNAGAGAIYNGQKRKPLLFEIDGTSACKINACSGYFH